MIAAGEVEGERVVAGQRVHLDVPGHGGQRQADLVRCDLGHAGPGRDDVVWILDDEVLAAGTQREGIVLAPRGRVVD